MQNRNEKKENRIGINEFYEGVVGTSKKKISNCVGFHSNIDKCSIFNNCVFSVQSCKRSVSEEVLKASLS